MNSQEDKSRITEGLSEKHVAKENISEKNAKADDQMFEIDDVMEELRARLVRTGAALQAESEAKAKAREQGTAKARERERAKAAGKAKAKKHRTRKRPRRQEKKRPRTKQRLPMTAGRCARSWAVRTTGKSRIRGCGSSSD